jgi:hypothetical protein
MSRERWTRVFLWISVLGLGIGLGAKLFDLVVLARAYSAALPASLSFYPYGPHWPVNPGDFFQPLSVPIVVGIVGALINGWKTPFYYRIWLWMPVILFVVLWIFTPTVFWPIIRELYAAASGRVVRSDADLIWLVRRWVTYDWLRVAGLTLAFISSVRAISMPYPGASLST